MSGQSLTDEEYSLIREYLILPFVKNMVKKNRDKIKGEGLTLSPLFAESCNKVLGMIDDDINETRKQIGRLQAKITEVKRNDDGILYAVRLRGYVHEIAMIRHTVMREMAKRRDTYTSRMFENMINK